MSSTCELTDRDLAAIERDTRAIGRGLFERSSQDQPSVWDRRWWDDRIMAWAMQDESVKVQMFRFVDVLPMLSSSAAVTQHLHEYFHDVRSHLPSAARLGLAVAAPDSIAGRALALAARRNAMGHARRFIAGTTQNEVLAAAMRERKLSRAFTLDFLGEAVTSEREAERYLQAYLDLVGGIAPVVNAWEDVPLVDCAEGVELPRVMSRSSSRDSTASSTRSIRPAPRTEWPRGCENYCGWPARTAPLSTSTWSRIAPRT
jgi:RHH-type proline utilization regulon transcriptional repressor/proline dehydrogenase/delta 1-pyrroline-5-carboxylate dehydrogenase